MTRMFPAVVCVACLLATQAVETQQAPVFSAATNAVRVDVSVQAQGRAIRGLQAADFEVLDNGVQQRVDLVDFDNVSLNVVLTLDMSGSVRGERLLQLRQASEQLMAALAPGDATALVTFTDIVSIRAAFSSSRDDLLAALRQPVPGADTSLVDAVHAAMTLGESESGRPLVIVFSDGADTASFLTPDLALDTARRTGSVVYVVTTPQVARSEFLDDLVELTGGRRLEISSMDRLSGAFAEILAESRERYLISFTPEGVAPDGWHDLVVRVRNRRADVRARPGYHAGASR